jgi:hypothetical protein
LKRPDHEIQVSNRQLDEPEARMLSGVDLIRVLGLGLVAISLGAVIISAASKGLAAQARMLRINQSRADILQWAQNNGYTILIREAARESPFLDESDRQVVYRVVIRDQRGEIRRGSVWCGGPLKVQWIDRREFASPAPSKRHPLWDRDLDA